MARDNLLVSLKEEVKMILSTHEVSSHFVKFIVYLRAFSRGSQKGKTTIKVLRTEERSCLIAFKCQFSSVAQLCPTLCDPMDCSTPGFPVLHQLLELAQTHVHWVSDVIQPSHLLLSPSTPTFNLSQHQGFFQWVSCLDQVAKVLELQHQSFQLIFRVDFL